MAPPCGSFVRVRSATIPAMPFAGKPIIGIVGGIGSGKSFVARAMASLGCFVIDSDALAREAHADPSVLDSIRRIAGDEVVVNGKLDRRALASLVFADDTVRRRVEQVIHPWVEQRRGERMRSASADPSVRAFVWDSPLLMESGLDPQCDHVIFVETPRDLRLARVRASRGWSDDDLRAREARQAPLEKKRQRADAVVDGTWNEADLRTELARWLARWTAPREAPPNR